MTDHVGANGHSYPEVASRAVTSASHQSPSPVYGYFRTGAQQKIYLFTALEDARGWLTALIHGQAQPYDYAAVFASTDLTRPVPGLESFGHTTVSGDAYVGADAGSYRGVASKAVTDAHRQSPSAAYGYQRTGYHQRIYLFASLGDAQSWYAVGEAQEPYDYRAVFAATNLHVPVAEDFGRTSVSGDTAVGSFLPFLLGLPLGALGGYFYRDWQEKHPGHWLPGISGDYGVGNDYSIGGPWHDMVGPQVGGPWLDMVDPQVGGWHDMMGPQVGGPWHDMVGPQVGGPWLDMAGPQVGGPWHDMVGEGSGYTVGGPWLDVVGAQAYPTDERVQRHRAWPQTKALIQSAINEVTNAAAAAPAVAYVWSLDPPGPSPSSQVELEGETMVVPLASHAQALDYMRSRIQTPHVALALFDRTSPHWPNPVNWTRSNDPAYEPLVAAQAAKATGTRAAGDYVGAAQTTIGTALDDVRTRAQSLAKKRAGSVIGVIHTLKDNLWHALAFRNEDDADDWLGTATQDPAAYTYAAYYDKDDAAWPHPVNEKIGGLRTPSKPGAPIRREIATTSGAHIGAVLDDVRSHAKALATSKPGNAAGVIHTADGLWNRLGFRSLDDAVDWLQSSTRDKASFTYAAIFEKGADGTAYFQDEEVGGARVSAEPGPPIHRGIATTSGSTWWAA